MSDNTKDTEASAALTPAHAARTLIRQAAKASLATILPDPAGWPFASMVIPASDADASPLFVLSDLAQHARNLALDSRASLLVEGIASDGNIQATPRVTLVGHVRRTDDATSRRRFLARHDDSYLDVLGDFHLYRMAVERAHYIGGFARARRMEAAEFLLSASALAGEEGAVLDWLNADEGGRVKHIAARQGLKSADWRAVAIDAEGCDIADGTHFARLTLEKTVVDSDQFKSTIDVPQA